MEERTVRVDHLHQFLHLRTGQGALKPAMERNAAQAKAVDGSSMDPAQLYVQLLRLYARYHAIVAHELIENWFSMKRNRSGDEV